MTLRERSSNDLSLGILLKCLLRHFLLIEKCQLAVRHSPLMGHIVMSSSSTSFDARSQNSFRNVAAIGANIVYAVPTC